MKFIMHILLVVIKGRCEPNSGSRVTQKDRIITREGGLTQQKFTSHAAIM